MASLPTPHDIATDDVWGTILNEYLLVAHKADGTNYTVSLVVAASDAPAYQKAQADYTCDGDADEVQINIALTAAYTGGGGIVELSSGNFSLKDKILIPSNVTLKGQGFNTKLKFDTSIGDKTMITNNCGYVPGSRHPTGNVNITVRDIYVDGDKDHRGAGTDATWTVGFNTVQNLTIKNVYVVNGWTASIRTEFCTNVWIIDNDVDKSGDDGIAINEETYKCTCLGNHVNNTGLGKSYGGPHNIEVQDGARDVVVAMNFSENAASTYGAGVQISTHSGKSACQNVAVVQNICRDNPFGLQIYGISGTREKGITLANNQIFQAAAGSIWGITTSYCQDTVITGNKINTTKDGLRLQNENVNVIITGNALLNDASAGNSQAGMDLSGTLTNVSVVTNSINNFGYIGIITAGTLSGCHLAENQILGVTNGSGICIRFNAQTATSCTLMNNNLEGSYLYYDADTTTYQTIHDGWSIVESLTVRAIAYTGGVAAGRFVNLFNNGGVLTAQCAHNYDQYNRPAHGFVLKTFGVGKTALVYLKGVNPLVSGRTIGALQYLTSDGNPTETFPAESYGVQELGIALSATAILFSPNPANSISQRYFVQASGTPYSLTATLALLDFGTTDPVIIIRIPGTYRIRAYVHLKYNAATFAANRTVQLCLYRSNNTPGILLYSNIYPITAIVTTHTGTFCIVEIPPFLYTTANNNDSIELWGKVDVVPSAGSLDVIAAQILAERVY